MRYFDNIWYICIIGQGGVLHSRIVVLPCWTYKLSPLNELYRRKLVHSITLIPFEIFLWSLVDIYIRWKRNLKVKMKSLQSAFHFCSQWHSVLSHQIYILGWLLVTAYQLLFGRGICHLLWWLFLMNVCNQICIQWIQLIKFFCLVKFFEYNI